MHRAQVQRQLSFQKSMQTATSAAQVYIWESKTTCDQTHRFWVCPQGKKKTDTSHLDETKEAGSTNISRTCMTEKRLGIQTGGWKEHESQQKPSTQDEFTHVPPLIVLMTTPIKWERKSATLQPAYTTTREHRRKTLLVGFHLLISSLKL